MGQRGRTKVWNAWARARGLIAAVTSTQLDLLNNDVIITDADKATHPSRACTAKARHDSCAADN